MESKLDIDVLKGRPYIGIEVRGLHLGLRSVETMRLALGELWRVWKWAARSGACGVVGLLALGVADSLSAQEPTYLRPPIDYLEARAQDPVARLQERLDRGELTLKRDRKWGYLPSILEALGVSSTSQALVFSKTSFQAPRISPRSPRAIYHGDDVYVGWVPGGDVVEISAVDPELGAVYYLLDQAPSAKPTFERESHGCLSCHSSGRTQDVPGHLVRSVYPKPDGLPAYNAGSFVTGHESPLSERWGGWFVTGTHGDQRHMGNVFVRDRDDPEDLDTASGANLHDLSDRINVSGYLVPTSDIVSLMVLEHQTQMHNRITAAGYAARQALDYQKGINASLKLPETEVWDSTKRRIEGPAEKLVEYLLFCGETKLTAPIRGTSGYSEDFQARGSRDSRGRSLRDLDLNTRLFRYPCSYLIGTECFIALPEVTKQYVYGRLLEILTGKDDSAKFEHLSTDDCRAILEILVATHPDLRERWKHEAE